MNRLVRHHEAFAEFCLGPSTHLRWGVLDFTNDKASSVPVRQKGKKKEEMNEENLRGQTAER